MSLQVQKAREELRLKSQQLQDCRKKIHALESERCEIETCIYDIRERIVLYGTSTSTLIRIVNSGAKVAVSSGYDCYGILDRYVSGMSPTEHVDYFQRMFEGHLKSACGKVTVHKTGPESRCELNNGEVIEVIVLWPCGDKSEGKYPVTCYWIDKVF